MAAYHQPEPANFISLKASFGVQRKVRAVPVPMPRVMSAHIILLLCKYENENCYYYSACTVLNKYCMFCIGGHRSTGHPPHDPTNTRITIAMIMIHPCTRVLCLRSRSPITVNCCSVHSPVIGVQSRRSVWALSGNTTTNEPTGPIEPLPSFSKFLQSRV